MSCAKCRKHEDALPFHLDTSSGQSMVHVGHHILFPVSPTLGQEKAELIKVEIRHLPQVWGTPMP